MTLWSAFAENSTDGDIRLTIDSTTLIASTLILGLVGVVSGMLPAIKASASTHRSPPLRVREGQR